MRNVGDAGMAAHYKLTGGQRRRIENAARGACVHNVSLDKKCRECTPIPQIEDGRMTPEQFGFFVRGLVTAAMPNAEMTRMVLDAAREHLTGTRVASSPIPAMKLLKVPQFCLHDVNVQEICAACPAGGRLFGFHLPPDCRAVYIAAPTAAQAVGLSPSI